MTYHRSMSVRRSVVHGESNLCTSLSDEGKLAEALHASNAVANNSPSASLATKAKELIAKIREQARRSGVALRP